MLILFTFLYLISIAFASNGCNDAMLEMRIKDLDFPPLVSHLNTNNSDANYTRVNHCRAHSFTSPAWLHSTIVALNVQHMSTFYFAVLHYHSCDTATSRFNSPIILRNLTRYDASQPPAYVIENEDADYCYSCVNNKTIGYCNKCHINCTTDYTGDLDYCYGPSMNDCCKYIQDEDCVSMCSPNNYPNENSICSHICEIHDPCVNGVCSKVNTTGYSCTCADDYTGTNCSIVSPCNQTEKCNDNGDCSATLTPPYFTCNCAMGVYGNRCEYNQLCNDSILPCKNGGNCTAMQSDKYMCSCTDGFTGNNCQTSAATGGAPVAIAAVVVIVIVIIVIIVVIVVIIIVYYFYVKRKRGKVDIARKTSKVYPSNDKATIDEKEPILEKEKQ